MRRPGKEPEEPLLFDLPLDSPEPAASEVASAKRTVPREAPPAPLPLRAREREERTDPALPVRGPAAEPRAAGPIGVPVGRRLGAGLFDLLLHTVVVAGLYLGSRLLGLRLTWTDWPAALLFVVPFSFLYSVVPLAFWGKTPGMASTGLLSQNAKGDPLTFDQTARRWLGGLLTLATLALPLLVTGRRRSLADVLSGSVTLDAR
ncbi:MAG TPA: RDD family protein [Thermoanaerobaculia bacterium]